MDTMFDFAPMPEPRRERVNPATLVHYVPVGQGKLRVYEALCGELIHKAELSERAHGETTCPKCKELL